MKSFKLQSHQIKQLIESMGSCIASDKITVEGLPVGFMYREDPSDKHDSGWRFFSGTETQEYADNGDNFMYYNINTIANYDSAVIPYLNLPQGSELLRVQGSVNFEIDYTES
ncbi:DUF2185 domain-containing protein [Hymenobacter sp. BT507]|uniref:DUF2185 domain-containing protein n=1 Tax=Hymenobacter citatus TaxID=2763506 RepID=A0ABR7MQ98_9BACT|nr:DUF2185 domain-containing protein [Hymenobacter citatus]MBC6613262.1 DUF2185 domain-containing protein [Hymenobacter citatus]